MFCIGFFKVAGYFTDQFPAYINLPLSFCLRASACLVFINIEDPRTVYTYVALSLFILGTLFENTTVNGLFNKHLPKDIRGTLTGAYQFFGNFGILFFTKIGGYLYDTVSPNAPFILLASLDVLFALLVLLLRFCKKFNE